MVAPDHHGVVVPMAAVLYRAHAAVCGGCWWHPPMLCCICKHHVALIICCRYNEWVARHGGASEALREACRCAAVAAAAARACLV